MGCLAAEKEPATRVYASYMKIKTEEYCRQCPFFIKDLGYLPEDDPYWEGRPENKCVCENCPQRKKCEIEGSPSDISVCIRLTLMEGMTPEGVRQLHNYLLATRQVS